MTQTTIVNTQRLAQLDRLQRANEQLREQLDALRADLEIFPFAHPPIGDVPDSGKYEDWLALPAQETLLTLYLAMQDRKKSLEGALAANEAESKAANAQPAEEDALSVVLRAVKPVIDKWAGGSSMTDAFAELQELKRVYNRLAGGSQ